MCIQKLYLYISSNDIQRKVDEDCSFNASPLLNINGVCIAVVQLLRLSWICFYMIDLIYVDKFGKCVCGISIPVQLIDEIIHSKTSTLYASYMILQYIVSGVLKVQLQWKSTSVNISLTYSTYHLELAFDTFMRHFTSACLACRSSWEKYISKIVFEKSRFQIAMAFQTLLHEGLREASIPDRTVKLCVRW